SGHPPLDPKKSGVCARNWLTRRIDPTRSWLSRSTKPRHCSGRLDGLEQLVDGVLNTLMTRAHRRQDRDHTDIYEPHEFVELEVTVVCQPVGGHLVKQPHASANRDPQLPGGRAGQLEQVDDEIGA